MSLWSIVLSLSLSFVLQCPQHVWDYHDNYMQQLVFNQLMGLSNIFTLFVSLCISFNAYRKDKLKAVSICICMRVLGMIEYVCYLCMYTFSHFVLLFTFIWFDNVITWAWIRIMYGNGDKSYGIIELFDKYRFTFNIYHL